MARSIQPEEIQNVAPPPGFGDMVLLAVPVETFKEVSDLAAAHGMTFAQFLTRAAEEMRKKLGSKEAP